MKQNPAERLCAYVIRTYAKRLTDRQLRTPWTYLGSYEGVISGVVITGDVDSPGYRVMLVDLP